MSRSKPTRATRVIHELADYTERSGFSVDWCSSMSTVSIDSKGDEYTFMQGDEADQFIAEIDKLTKRYPSLDDYTAALALAKPYVESMA